MKFVRLLFLYVMFNTISSLIRRNCVRQGKASEGNEAVVTYGDLTESEL